MQEVQLVQLRAVQVKQKNKQKVRGLHKRTVQEALSHEVQGWLTIASKEFQDENLLCVLRCCMLA